jgi:hypothetical protein
MEEQIKLLTEEVELLEDRCLIQKKEIERD